MMKTNARAIDFCKEFPPSLRFRSPGGPQTKKKIRDRAPLFHLDCRGAGGAPSLRAVESTYSLPYLTYLTYEIAC